ncbi:MAG: ATP-binding protein [Candidatus Sericytochromatia bacterium]|nr:ATP-binding protein [Candidatus Tanganyikabacteria bacterium]
MSLVEMLKALILDSQDGRLEPGVPRELQVAPVPGKATVLVGVRRCGKSTYLSQVMHGLLARDVPRENILYLNFFDDRLHGMRHDDLGAIVEAYFGLYPAKKDTETVHCFFDEIQMVPGWEPFIDRLLRTEKCQIYLTGSSAKLLSKEVATQMRGRALSWELFPFSFREYLRFAGVPAGEALSTRGRLLVQDAFERYWAEGGFPEVAGLRRDLRIATHQDYLNAILFRDLIERHDISHPKALTDLAYWLIDNAGSLYSINGLTGHLKALGHRAPKAAVSEYLEWFEDAYFLFTVRLHDASLTRSLANPKKIYCVDHSLVTSVTSGLLVNSGHLLENLVFMALRRRHSEIRYYRTRTGREVDFAIPDRGRVPALVQVSQSLADRATRKRELAALGEAMREVEAKAATVVTWSEQEVLESEGRRIEVTPAWRFLLDGAARGAGSGS